MKQKGGVIPMAALIPGLVAGGKKAALAAIGAAVGHKTKQWLKKKNKRKTQKGRGLKRYYHARR